MSKNENIKRDDVIDELSKVRGVGPKYAEEMYDHLNVRSIEDLAHAAENNRLASLSGIGVKKQATILESAKRLMGQKDQKEEEPLDDSSRSLFPPLEFSVETSVRAAKRSRSVSASSPHSLSADPTAQNQNSAHISPEVSFPKGGRATSPHASNLNVIDGSLPLGVQIGSEVETFSGDDGRSDDEGTDMVNLPGFDDPLPLIFAKIAYEFGKQETKKAAKRATHGLARSVSKVFSIFSRNS